jgi:peptidyl-prolyl cis-trans isomerase C
VSAFLYLKFENVEMNKFNLGFVFPFVFLVAQGSWADEYIVTDGPVGLTYQEMEYAVSQWTDQMRGVAVQDEGDRLELVNLVLANRKIALEAEKIAKEAGEQEYYKYMEGLQAYQRDYALRAYRDAIELPDFSELAKERYVVGKEKNAKVPERRISSHILFAAPPGMDRKEIKIKAQEVLDELRAGADFEAYVEQYSQDPGSRKKKGKFDRWMKFGELGVSPPYSEGLFTIENVGEYSELVQTQFGVHIIRLDGIQEASYKSFEEVKDAIVAELEAEYVKLEMKDRVASFNMTDAAVVDDEAIQQILAPYTAAE